MGPWAAAGDGAASSASSETTGASAAAMRDERDLLLAVPVCNAAVLMLVVSVASPLQSRGCLVSDRIQWVGRGCAWLAMSWSNVPWESYCPMCT